MTFIIEDGIGRRHANSYSSVDFARDYSATRGRTEFDALTEDAVEVLLVRATDYIELRWGQRFPGTKQVASQGLSFPVTGGYDAKGNKISGVPLVICRATVELAQRATGLDRLLPDPPSPFPSKDTSGGTADIKTGEVASETKTVGPLTKTTTYAHSGVQSARVVTSAHLSGITIQEYPEVVQMISTLIAGGAGGVGTQTVKN